MAQGLFTPDLSLSPTHLSMYKERSRNDYTLHTLSGCGVTQHYTSGWFLYLNYGNITCYHNVSYLCILC